MHLTHAQKAAIRYVEKYASTRTEQAKEAIEEVRAMSNIPAAQLAQALWAIKTHARVVLHFHPDRLDNQGLTVAESLLTCGSYRNQFETGVSNGKLSPLPGGPGTRGRISCLGVDTRQPAWHRAKGPSTGHWT